MQMFEKIEVRSLVWPAGLHRNPNDCPVVSLTASGATMIGEGNFPRRQKLLVRLKLTNCPTRKIHADVVNRLYVDPQFQIIRVQFRKMDAESQGQIQEYITKNSLEMERKGTVLILDDSVQVCRVLETQIKAFGRKALSTTASKEALLKLGMHNIRMAIVDLVLGERQNGMNVLKTIAHFYPEVTRVLMSGYVDPHSIQERFQSGLVQEALAKPWQPRDIKNLILENTRVAV